MTKSIFSRYGVALLSLGGLLICFCSKLGDSTDLGSGVINSVDPGKTDIDKYFHGFLLDSSSIQESFSVPFAGDTGFGYHQVTPNASGIGTLLLGKANKEHSAGYFQVVLVRDSLPSTRVLIGDDTLKSLKMTFTCDSVHTSRQFLLYAVDKKGAALAPDQSQALGTISFNARGDTTQIDTVEIYDALNSGSFSHLFCDTIFKACTTSTKDTLQRRDTLRFAVVSLSDTLVHLRGSCGLILSARRPGTDTTLKVKSIASSQAWYIAAEDGNLEALSMGPISSFASKRTAVYKYRVDSLWKAMDAIGANSVLLTAGFLIPNNFSDTIFVRCIVRPGIEHDGVLLDSVFAVEGPILRILPKTTELKTQFASVVVPLQKMFADESKPPSVYVYVRYTNTTSVWKTFSLDIKPLFKAMITNP